MDSKTLADAHVRASIPDGNAYKTNSSLVLNCLTSGSKDYIPEFTNAIWSIISSETERPVSKFYALYLFSKAMENDNQELATHIAKQRSVLEILFKEAQYDGQKAMKDKGRKFFSKVPTNDEAVLGNSYIRLLLENFLHWNKIYTTADKKNPLILYSVMLNSLQTRVKFPDEFAYLTKEHNVNKNFHLKQHAGDLEAVDISPVKSDSSPELEKKSQLRDQLSSVRNSNTEGAAIVRIKPSESMEKLEREIARLKAEKGQLERENDKLSKMLKDGGGSDENKAIIDELRGLREENGALRDKLERVKQCCKAGHFVYFDDIL